jgi:hypothetical protein
MNPKSFLGLYSGDTLWAMMTYFVFALIFPRYEIKHLFILALSFSFFIESSQFLQYDWLNSIRSTTIGALVLGHGFLFSDLICYGVGVSFATILDRQLIILSSP